MPVSASDDFYNDIARALMLGARGAQTPIVIISPHIDDAVWSLGPALKALTSHGHKLRLINLFSTTVIVNDETALPAEATAARKAEDARAAREIGCEDVRYLDFPDGILRDRNPQTIFDPAYQTPSWLAEVLGTALKQHLPRHGTVLAPSGFGWHIDHQLAARIASRLPQKVVFYEDLPYAARTVRVQEARKFLQQQSVQEIRVPASAATIQEHLRLYRLYASQRADHHEEQISTHLAAHGYGLWR